MRKRLPLRRLSSLGRLFVALIVLVVVWLLASQGLDRAARDGEQRRLADRRTLTQGYAGLVRSWFEGGRDEALDLARGIGELRLAPGVPPARTSQEAAPTIEAYLRSEHEFGREVVLVDPGNNVVAGSAGRARGETRPCVMKDGSTDDSYAQFLAAIRAGQRPLRVVSVPWDCGTPRVASAEAAGEHLVVVLAPLAEGAGRIGPLEIGTLHLDLVDSEYGKPNPDPAAPAPTDRELFVREARGKAASTGRYAGVLGAYADAGLEWGVTVEQAQGEYDGAGPAKQSAWLGATVLAAALAVAFILMAFFDHRRRRVYARAEEAKHAFFATVGHELRTPLTILRGYSETLSSRWDALSDEAKEMLVSNMTPAAQRMGALVEKLLLASNIQAEAYIRPVVRPTDLDEVMARVADRFRPLAPLHTFRVVVDPDASEAMADADAVEQVLVQLVDNAVKYSPAGGTVTLVAERVRRGVELSVSDEGIGLPQNVSDIFDPLVQGEAVDTRVHDEGGAGVGLFIVRTLVKDMRGSVRAEPRQPKGSRFVVTLRATKTKASPRAQAVV